MTIEVHLDWRGETRLAGRLHADGQGPTLMFQYDPRWLSRSDAFSLDPTALPLQQGPIHGATLFGAFQDCGPDRWGRLLIERAVRKRILTRRPWRDLDYVLALNDSTPLSQPRLSDARGRTMVAFSRVRHQPGSRSRPCPRDEDGHH